jgi:pimeloyl-ACP methyl ester carboxylesterase
LTERPPIHVPTVALHGGNSGLPLLASPEREKQFFTGPYVRRVVPAAGHNLPQEAPVDFAAAVLSLVQDAGAKAHAIRAKPRD